MAPHRVLQLADASPALRAPLSAAPRIQYTCFDVSHKFLVFGATSGGIYVFNRNPVEFVQLIPSKGGVITKLSISPDEKYIALANSRGLVTVVECSQSATSLSSLLSKEHQGSEVTCVVWSSSPLAVYIGDDVGKISILQIPKFLTRSIFQTTAQVIMNLDSRVCQIDTRHYMLVISTITRCYICDTSKEQYRQIGQKLRDGEYGVCFLTKDGTEEITILKLPEEQEVKRYNVMAIDDNFAASEKFANTLIYCARPSSRLWEASIDGTVQRTHQYKQVLGRPPSQVVTETSHQYDNVATNIVRADGESQSINFAKILALKNCVIFTYKKDAIYFLNPENVEDTLWVDKYKNIVDCKVHQNTVYVWLQDGSMQTLLFLKIDKYLVKCYVEEKYVLCGELCALYNEYLMTSNTLSPKLHVVSGLRDKLSEVNSGEMLEKISAVLDKFESLKDKDSTQMESGIFFVDNTYHRQTLFLDDDCPVRETVDDNTFLPPDAMQALKGISISVTDTFSSSKKKLKEKWDDLEEKMKNIGVEKHLPYDVRQPGEITPVNKEIDEIVQDNIIYKESSQEPTVAIDNNLDKDTIYKALYQEYKLSLVNKEFNNLCHIIDIYSCDINEIYQLFVQFENYCTTIYLTTDESKFISSTLFLNYIETSKRTDNLLNTIIEEPTLYQYFVDSCITVNLKRQKIANLACDCGYPLPYSTINQTPAYSSLIDSFIEKQWSSQTQAKCYEICKKMPYLWRKILYLRRNEDLLNILLILLQMLDEKLLHSFLPHFTINTWDKAIQLYSILYTNVCLNCRKRFENVIVKEHLSWDTLGGLLIKSVGGKEAVKMMERHGDLIGAGELTMRFYHTCLMVSRFEKYDGLIRNQLTDALYAAHEFENSRKEICNILRDTIHTDIKNTSLPLIVAAQSSHWGLAVKTRNNLNSKTNNLQLPTEDNLNSTSNLELHEESITEKPTVNLTLKEILDDFAYICTGVNDCSLCGLPLMNEVLIKDGGLWVFRCGHTFHGACLDLLKVKLCPSCIGKRDEG